MTSMGLDEPFSTHPRRWRRGARGGDQVKFRFGGAWKVSSIWTVEDEMAVVLGIERSENEC